MTILLDENFPLGLVRVLEADGLHVEHIITLGWRGASDTRIRTRLSSPEVLFLTQDEDFLFGEAVASTVVVSRVRQARRLDRTDWTLAQSRRRTHANTSHPEAVRIDRRRSPPAVGRCGFETVKRSPGSR